MQEGALGDGGAEWLKAPLSVTGREEGEWTVQPNGEGHAYAIGQAPWTAQPFPVSLPFASL